MKRIINKLGNTVAVSVVFAQDTIINLSPTEGIGAELNTLTIGGIISAAIRLVMIIAAVIFFFILVIGGIRWIMSGGDKANTEGARNQITAALVGLVIVFSAWAIIQLIQTFFGVTILGDLVLPSAK